MLGKKLTNVWTWTDPLEVFRTQEIMETDALRLKKNFQEPDSPTFYGIYSKADNGFSPKEKFVSTDKNEVLRILKLNKRARFKTFANEEEAAFFSINGLDVEENTNSPSSQTNDKSIFKAPKTQELVKFRLSIERFENDYAMHCINENPRYLISSGDTPSILQEGTRYNALHVCARVNNAQICKFILNTIGNVNFIERLYASKTGAQERSHILLDLYLNTPDKGFNETPLHFACKFGSLDVVKALVLHEQCDRNAFNKYQQTPLDIVCDRAKNSDNKEAIISTLEATYFIPLLRSPDGTVQPIVGEPFTPSTLSSVVDESNGDVTSPRMKICALAGPMKENEASSFRKKLKTPPRYRLNSPRLDPDKGLEKLGRDVALVYNVPWKEYWEFLDSFIDLTSPEGLDLLELHLKKKLNNSSEITCNGYSHKSFPETPKMLTNGFRKSNNHVTRERTVSHESNPLSPMSELCAGFEHLSIADDFSFDSNSCVLNSYQIYGNHIATAIKKKNKRNFIVAVDRFHSFIASCSSDSRLRKVNFAESHPIIAQIVFKRLRDDIHHDLEFLSCITQDSSLSFPDFLSHTAVGICEAYKCIASFLIDAAERNNANDVNKSTLSGVTCKCKIFRSTPHLKRVRKQSYRRLNFSDDSDSSGYATPCASSDGSDDEKFVEAEEGSKEYFLKGSMPTKLDCMVLEAIKDVKINNTEHPFIFFWKNLCLKYEKRLPKEQWSSTPKKS